MTGKVKWVIAVACMFATVPSFAQSTFTPSKGVLCGPAGYNAPIEPSCYYPILGTGSDGQPRWLDYNTSNGTITIIKFVNGAEQVEFAGPDLSVTVTTVLFYSIPAGPAYGQWATTVKYQEMRGTFNGGTLDLIFETVGQYKPFGRYIKTWQYDVNVVNEVTDQNGNVVVGEGPSYVTYAVN